MSEVTTRSFGRIFQEPCSSFDNQVQILDSSSPTGTLITWANVNGLWISLDVYCRSVTWESLRKMGYIYGTPVHVDGRSYLCRSLRVALDGELGAVIKEIDQSSVKEQWSNEVFFGQEFIPGAGYFHEDRCSIAGGYSRTMVRATSIEENNLSIGFRPVLEPYDPNQKVTQDMVGCLLKVYCGSVVLTGILREYTDYDLVLKYKPEDFVPQDHGAAAIIDDGVAIINLDAVLCIKHADM